MKRHTFRALSLLAVVMFLSMTALELTAQARVGGGRSLGGSRSYSRPASPYSQPSPSRQQYAPAPSSSPFQQQPAGGGFMRSMAGGMMGGMLGNLLFSGSAGAGGMGGGMGGRGGMGLFEIILLAGGGYLVYRILRGRSN